MKLEEYLENLIKESIEVPVLSKHEKKKLEIEGLENYILGKLGNSKFKGSKISKVLFRKIQGVVNESVSQNLPIHITVPFGGYKKWQLPNAPHVRWAELFNMLQLREYAKQISQVYEPGVLIEYFSDEVFVSRMNNIPQEDLDLYSLEFSRLVKYVNSQTNSNIKLKFSKIRDQIDQTELFNRFEVAIKELKNEWMDLPEKDRESRLSKSERSYKGDLSKLSVVEKEELLLESTLVHDAFIFGDWETGVPWAFGSLMIPVGFRYTGTWGIHLKSSRSSTVQFWVGVGALREYQESYLPTILTYEQYKSSHHILEKSVAIDGLSEISASFNSIMIIPQ